MAKSTAGQLAAYRRYYERNREKRAAASAASRKKRLERNPEEFRRRNNEKALVYYRMYLERRPDKLRLWRARQQIRLLTGIPSADIPDELVEAKAQLLAIRALLKKHGTNAHPRAFPRPKIAG